MNFILRLLVNGLAILITAYLIPGVEIESPAWCVVIAAVLVLLDTIVKPFMIILTLPITIFSLGLFLLVINALVVSIASELIPGFAVSSFWSALAFSLVVAIIQSIFDTIAVRED